MHSETHITIINALTQAQFMVGSTIDYDRLSSIFVYYNRIFYSRKFVDNYRTLPNYFSTIAIDVGNYHPSLTAVRLSIIGANATVD